MFVADNWRVTPKLTLNAGLHYEINSPFSDSQGNWANFNPATATVELAGQNGVPTQQTGIRIILLSGHALVLPSRLTPDGLPARVRYFL